MPAWESFDQKVVYNDGYKTGTVGYFHKTHNDLATQLRRKHRADDVRRMKKLYEDSHAYQRFLGTDEADVMERIKDWKEGQEVTQAQSLRLKKEELDFYEVKAYQERGTPKARFPKTQDPKCKFWTPGVNRGLNYDGRQTKGLCGNGQDGRRMSKADFLFRPEVDLDEPVEATPTPRKAAPRTSRVFAKTICPEKKKLDKKDIHYDKENSPASTRATSASPGSKRGWDFSPTPRKSNYYAGPAEGELESY